VDIVHLLAGLRVCVTRHSNAPRALLVDGSGGCVQMQTAVLDARRQLSSHSPSVFQNADNAVLNVVRSLQRVTREFRELAAGEHGPQSDPCSPGDIPHADRSRRPRICVALRSRPASSRCLACGPSYRNALLRCSAGERRILRANRLHARASGIRRPNVRLTRAQGRSAVGRAGLY